MGAQKRLSSPQMYTVGWITALAKELAAACAILDEEHDKPENFLKHARDTNNYAWGRIGDHNIVIASLADGKYGLVSAATTASCLISSLPHLRFGLMVGIGAGIPRLADSIDIRLGDVVVSRPNETSPGVVQYDLGKLGADGNFKRVGSLASPPPVILQGLTTLRAIQRRKGSRIPSILQHMLENNPLLAESDSDDAAFVHQGTQNDRLFRATSLHVQSPDGRMAGNSANTTASNNALLHFQLVLAWTVSFIWPLFALLRNLIHLHREASSTQIESHTETKSITVCAHCDPGAEVKRSQRKSTHPVVHYGIIASGNTVVKDGISRDDIMQRTQDQCICFEMEAAGLMDAFPCLVIRGICDYADTHKDDRWQNYAAATAAAFAKELLEVMDGQDVEQAPDITEVMGKLHEEVVYIRSDINVIRNDTQVMAADQQAQKIKNWLSPPEPSTNYNEALKQRQEGTGQWFLDSRTYSQWKTKPRSSLWLYGIPGCGKTIMSSIVVEDLRNSEAHSNHLLYFYFDFKDPCKQSLDNAVRSLISQLSEQSETAYTYLKLHHLSTQPSTDQLCKIFEAMIHKAGPVSIVLDALDECQERQGTNQKGLLPWVRALVKNPELHINILLTSRPEPDIKSYLSGCTENHISLQSDLVSEDIRTYTHARVRYSEGFARWRSREDIQYEVEQGLVERANGMFRWVSCQLDALEKCLDPQSIRLTLKTLPRTLDETYERILRSIPPELMQNARRILQFLVYSERPLWIEEVVDIIAVNLEERPRFDVKNRMPDPEEIPLYCSSLIALATSYNSETRQQSQILQLAHFSVKEFLLSDRLEEESSQHFRSELANASMVKVCVAYLMELDHDAGNKQAIHPLLDYAARFWMKHAVDAGSHGPCGIVREFFQSRSSYEEYLVNSQAGSTFLGTYDSSKNHQNFSGLHLAAFGGILHVVNYMLDEGADIDLYDYIYGTPLQLAVLGGHYETVELLLNRGAYINEGRGSRGAPLFIAMKERRHGIARLLLDKGANVNQANFSDCKTALHEASHIGYHEIVQLLLDYGADVNTENKDGQTALHLASKWGRNKVVRSLLAKGADVAKSDRQGHNSLEIACQRNREEVVQILLAHTALGKTQ